MPTIRDGLDEALKYHRSGKLMEAESIYRQINELAPLQPDAWHLRGVIATQIGRPDVALEHIRKAIELNPFTPVFHNSLGSTFEALGQIEKALEEYERALEIKGDYSEAHFNVGRMHERLRQFPQAQKAYHLALRCNAGYPEAEHRLGRVALELNQADEAAEHFRKALRIKPEFLPAMEDLGVLRIQQQRYTEAENQFRKLLELRPQIANAHHQLGLALQGQSRLDEAEREHAAALRLDPNMFEAQNNLGICLALRGKLQDAAVCFRETIKLRPEYSDAHSNLGNVYLTLGQRDQAVDCYKQAIALNPDNAQAYSNFAAVLGPMGLLTEAAQCAQRAAQLQPEYADAHNNLANVYKELGLFKESIAESMQALRIRPFFPPAHSNLLLTSNYDPQATNEQIFEIHQQYFPKQGAHLARTTAHANLTYPDRPLRIGYVSPDLREHPVTSFLEPILANHDRRVSSVVLYNDVSAPDVTTTRLANYGHEWRNTHGRTDDEVAAMVQADGVDILIDLAGHTAHNRLPMFARKPAPVQVSYIGYPSTTGVPTIDYLITDNVIDQPGDDRFYTEKLVRLEPSFCCFTASPFCPNVAPLPAMQRGQITFGSLNGLMKLNDHVLMFWARLLREVPNSRLLLIRNTIRGPVADRIRNLFRHQGIDDARIDLRDNWGGGRMHYAAYEEIDIALDVFPWSGHTTACEALWMGVPVVTLYGARHAGRMVSSVLNAAGLSGWIAQSPEQYISIAQQLASNLPGLIDTRVKLRGHLAASPLCDGKRFTAQLEQAYRQMWRAWAAS